MEFTPTNPWPCFNCLGRLVGVQVEFEVGDGLNELFVGRVRGPQPRQIELGVLEGFLRGLGAFEVRHVLEHAQALPRAQKDAQHMPVQRFDITKNKC